MSHHSENITDKARGAVRLALANGTLTAGPCELEGEADCLGAIQAHHEDYSKPLDVRWFCRRHHRRLYNGVDGGAARKGRGRVAVTVYFDPALDARLRALAQEEGRSLAAQIVRLVEAGLSNG